MRVHTCCACALECSALRACIKKDLVHGIEIRIQQQRVSTCTGCMLSRELACMHTAAKVLPNRVSRLRQCSLTTSCVIKLACVENAWGWERRFGGVDARGVLVGGAPEVAICTCPHGRLSTATGRFTCAEQGVLLLSYWWRDLCDLWIDWRPLQAGQRVQ